MQDYKIVEELPGRYSTHALVTSETADGLDRGIAAYFVRFHPFAYGAKVVRITNEHNKMSALIVRSSTCD